MTGRGKEKNFFHRKKAFFSCDKRHICSCPETVQGRFFRTKLLPLPLAVFWEGAKKKKAFVFEDPWFFLDGVEGVT